MNFESIYRNSKVMLMEGALGERLKHEYQIPFDEVVAMAGLIYQKESKQALKELFMQYIGVAKNYRLPIMTTTPTRRANKERVENSKYNKNIIRDNVSFLRQIKQEASHEVYIGGLMGCKGDAYKATGVLAKEEAAKFHSWQADLFAEEKVDFLYAGIMPALSEAIGMANAMEKTGLPYIISFMIRKDGRLIDGTTIQDAIITIDTNTIRKPLCYMTNCVHPRVVFEALSQSFNQSDIVRERFKGIQANTSPLSPEELDNSIDLHTSEPVSWAADMYQLYKEYQLKLFGGCCGSNNMHIDEIAKRLGEINGN